jgi:hypothetical protein
MPLILNVGSSRKASKDYNSTGVDLHLTAELPNDVVSQPEQIATAVNDLYELVHRLLDEQIDKLAGQQSDRDGARAAKRGTNSNGNGSRKNGHFASAKSNGSTRSNGQQDRKLTQAQSRAIENMTRRLDEDANAWVEHEFGVNKVSDLTVRQASSFIDILKTAIESTDPQEASR